MSVMRTLRWHVAKLQRATGYDFEHLARKRQNDAWRSALRAIPCADLDCLEISPASRSTWREGWRS